MVHTRETIYKRTSSGKVQIWYGELEDNKYRTVSGQEDGKKTTSEWTVCFGKNAGKANETTDEQQAAFELDALYKKKLDRQYRRDKDGVDVKHYIEPMLASKWIEDFKKRPAHNETIALQPKFDGMRAIATSDGVTVYIKSRDGKIIPGAKFICEALRPVFEAFPDLILDGELYNHELHDDFEEIMSLVKREDRTPEQDEQVRQKVQYHIYDMPSHPGDYQERYDTLVPLLTYGEMFHLAHTEFYTFENVEDRDEAVVRFNTEMLELNYEGSMVRVVKGKYENKRSKWLFKVKLFQEDEFPLEDVMEGKGNWAGYAKAVRVLLPNGNICKSGIKGDQAYCKQLLEDWKSGKLKKGAPTTVSYLRYSKAGMLNLPVMKTIRWDV